MTSTVDIPIKFSEPGFLGLGTNAPTLLFFTIAAIAVVFSIIMFIKKNKYKKISATFQTSVEGSVASKLKIIKNVIIVSVVVFVISLFSACFTMFSNKALADNSGVITANAVLLSIDPNSNISTYENGSITNGTKNDVKLDRFYVVKSSGVKEVNSDCIITIKSENNIIFRGGPHGATESFSPNQTIIIPAEGGSIPISATIQGLTKTQIESIMAKNEPMIMQAVTSTLPSNNTQAQESIQQTSQNATSTDQQVLSSLNAADVNASSSSLEPNIDASENIAENNNTEKVLMANIQLPDSDLVYNGQPQCLGYVKAYVYESETRRYDVNGAAHISYNINGGPETSKAEACDAGNYIVHYKIACPGCKSIEGVFTNSISKADNPLKFVLDPCDSIVAKNNDNYTTIEFTPASANMECSSDIYYTLEEGSDHEYFDLPDSQKNSLNIESFCPLGEHKLYIKATLRSNNYLTYSVTQELTIHVNSTKIKKVSGINILNQDVTFLPAYNDDDPTYLYNNCVTYYYDEKGEIPCDNLNSSIKTGINMHDLSNYIKSAKDINDGVLYAKANEGTVFYGVVSDTAYDVFDYPTEYGSTADRNAFRINPEGNLYKYLTEDIGTVYFDGKDGAVQFDQGWGCWKYVSNNSTDNPPRLNNNVLFSDFAHSYCSNFSFKEADVLSTRFQWLWQYFNLDKTEERSYCWDWNSGVWYLFPNAERDIRRHIGWTHNKFLVTLTLTY